MSALPAPGSFLSGAGSQVSRGVLFEDWLAFMRNQIGGSTGEALRIIGNVIYPVEPSCYVLNPGDAAEGVLDSVATITEFAPGQIIRIQMGNPAQKFTVRNGFGTIVLKTATFRLETGWERLFLELNGDSTRWIEVGRDYGQSLAQFRNHHGIDGSNPIGGWPATYSHATGPQALAGTAENATMTPAAVAAAMTSGPLMVDNRPAVGDRSPADTFLVSRGGTLVKMNILTLLAPSFSSYVETGELGIAAGTSAVAAHGVGAQPRLVRGFFRCKVAENNFNVGMEVPLECTLQDAASRRVQYGADAANYYYKMSAAGNVTTVNRGNGADVALTNANWRFFMRLWR